MGVVFFIYLIFVVVVVVVVVAVVVVVSLFITRLDPFILALGHNSNEISNSSSQLLPFDPLLSVNLHSADFTCPSAYLEFRS